LPPNEGARPEVAVRENEEGCAASRPLVSRLWLADNLAVPLDFELNYQETFRTLRLP
jgi:hypothetical protein